MSAGPPLYGGLWIAWSKKSSGVKSDLGEDVLRAAALRAGLVDNEVCAIDETRHPPEGPRRASTLIHIALWSLS